MQNLPKWGPASDEDRYVGTELLVSEDMHEHAEAGNDPLHVFQTGVTVVIRATQYHGGQPMAFLVERDGQFKMFPADMVLSAINEQGEA